jgi:hypothetical protein
MVAAGGDHQQGFALRVPAVAAENQPPDRFAALGAARLARAAGRDALPLEGGEQKPDLRRFPGPVAAFEGDEPAARRRRRRAQRRPPQIR